MAIVSSIKGIEVTVEVDGTALKEYADPLEEDHESDSEVIRYVEAQAGKNFSILIRFTAAFKLPTEPHKGHLNTVIKADGQCVRSSVCHLPHHYERSHAIDGVRMMEDGVLVERPLVFAPLDIDSSLPKSKADPDSLKELGQIVVSIYRGARMEDITQQQQSLDKFEQLGKIHEKSLKGKALSCSTGLGQATPVVARTRCFFTAYDQQPWGEYKLRYRSLNDLKSEMIIPRSPSPIPLEDRPEEDLSLEEARELIRRQRADMARIKPELKRERATNISSVGSDDLTIVERPAKRPRAIESIDLTSD